MGSARARKKEREKGGRGYRAGADEFYSTLLYFVVAPFSLLFFANAIGHATLPAHSESRVHARVSERAQIELRRPLPPRRVYVCARAHTCTQVTRKRAHERERDAQSRSRRVARGGGGSNGNFTRRCAHLRRLLGTNAVHAASPPGHAAGKRERAGANSRTGNPSDPHARFLIAPLFELSPLPPPPFTSPRLPSRSEMSTLTRSRFLLPTNFPSVQISFHRASI